MNKRIITLLVVATLPLWGGVSVLADEVKTLTINNNYRLVEPSTLDSPPTLCGERWWKSWIIHVRFQ